MYTSPLERAVETADVIARRHGLVPKMAEDLGEVRLGDWEGLAFEELDKREDWRRYNTYRSGTRPPGGELMIEIQNRMVRQAECLCRRHPRETVALVSHGDPLRALLAHYLGIPLDLLLRFEVYPASVSVVEAGEWTARVLSLNDTGEIPL